MKPISFRIQNYKSIKDSGECYFEPGYTILAGKNESGKSTVLEALRDFDIKVNIEEDVRPISITDSADITKISVTFEVTKKELEEDNNYIFENVKNKNKVIITKIVEANEIEDKPNNRYEYVCEFTARSQQTFEEYCKEKIQPIEEWIHIIPPLKSTLKSSSYEELKSFLNEYYNEETGNMSFPRGEVIKLASDIDSFIDTTKSTLNSFTPNENKTQKLLDTLINNKLPNFIFYSSFEDFFPDELSIEKIEKNKFAQDLAKISNFKIREIISENKQKQANHERTINLEFSELFNKYWTQDNIKLLVKKDGKNIHFWIEENGILFKPSQRSQGQKWFLSFYVRIVARMREDIANVILIDEPGLFLHAKAQKDMLKTLKDKFKDNLIIFSTHSPYLIEENEIGRIRLVEKINNETNIYNKVWAHVKDKETRAPILTAIGLSVGDSITDRNRNNIICEGPEDVFYLKAFFRKFNKAEVSLICAHGASKASKIAAILKSWGCRIKILYDNDTEGNRIAKKALKNFDSHEIMFANENGGSIVDLLSVADFKKYIIEDENVELISEKNSEYIKEQKMDKILFAKKFLHDIDNIELDSESLTNIENLLNQFVWEPIEESSEVIKSINKEIENEKRSVA